LNINVSITIYKIQQSNRLKTLALEHYAQKRFYSRSARTLVPIPSGPSGTDHVSTPTTTLGEAQTFCHLFLDRKPTKK